MITKADRIEFLRLAIEHLNGRGSGDEVVNLAVKFEVFADSAPETDKPKRKASRNADDKELGDFPS